MVVVVATKNARSSVLGFVSSVYISKPTKNCDSLHFASAHWTSATSATNCAFLSVTPIIHSYSQLLVHTFRLHRMLKLSEGRVIQVIILSYCMWHIRCCMNANYNTYCMRVLCAYGCCMNANCSDSVQGMCSKEL